MLSRRTFLASLGAAGLAQAQPSARPNILVFMSDQESELIPRNLLRLPNRERIERRGVRFTHAWCATPQCTPARGALWTGLWPSRTGMLGNIGAAGGKALDPSTPSIGKLFRSAGYQTGYFGKWHLSPGRPRDHEAYGFDTMQEDTTSAGDAGVAKAAAEWIGARGGPWLAIVSLIQPHDIYDFPDDRARLKEQGKDVPIRPGAPPPPSTAADLADRPAPQQQFLDKDQGKPTLGYGEDDWRRYRSYYYDLVEDVDKNLGVVLDALGGATDNTILVYTSDHGDGLGAHGLPFKGPYFYEELLRIPFVVSWPARMPKPIISDEFVSQVDLLPTLCDLAGVSVGETDGRSLRPALEGGSLNRDEIFSEYHSKQRWENPARIVRTRRWKLSVYLDGGRELYDLEADPHERKNLAGKGLEAEKDLLGRLDAWARRTGDPRWPKRVQ